MQHTTVVRPLRAAHQNTMNSSSSQHHLQIFNSIQSTKDKDSYFMPFQSLPTELRLKIWRQTLQRERIIRVSFERKPYPADIPKFDGKTVRHCAIMDGCQVLSKLLRVSHEARNEALRFYRVHIPCKLRGSPTGKDEETERPGTFYFNPEYDFLQIQPGFCGESSLIDFLYHLKNTYDPCRIGLLNYALGGGNALAATDLYSINPSDVNVELRESFVQTLAQLQEVFFVETVAVGRQILGALSGIGTNEIMLNRSMPIDATTPTFYRIHQDPRPISEDLKRAYIGTGPLRMLYAWQQLLKSWNVFPIQTSYQFILSSTPPLGQKKVHDQESARQWVQKEDYEWTGKWRIDDNVNGIWASRKLSDESTFKHPIGALYGKYKDEDLQKAVKPAFGFWVFPVTADAFGKMPTSKDEYNKVFTKQIRDMSKHWPGLGLMSLF